MMYQGGDVSLVVVIAVPLVAVAVYSAMFLFLRWHDERERRKHWKPGK